MSKLILVRHSRTEKSGYVSSFADSSSPLSRRGVLDAHRAGVLIMRFSRDHDRLDIGAVHTSPASSAQDTTSHLISKFDMLLPSPPIQVAQALSPRNFGEVAGLHWMKVRLDYGSQVDKWLNQPDAAPPGGETMRQVRARVVAYFTSDIVPLLKTGVDILVVSHNQVTNAIVRHLEGRANVWKPLRLSDHTPLIVEYNPSQRRAVGRYSLGAFEQKLLSFTEPLQTD